MPPAGSRPAELVRKGGVSLWLAGVGEVPLSCEEPRNLLDRRGGGAEFRLVGWLR